MSGRAIKYPITPFWLGMFLLRYFMPWFYIYIIYYFGQSVGQMLLNWLATNRNFIKKYFLPRFCPKDPHTFTIFSSSQPRLYKKNTTKFFSNFFFSTTKITASPKWRSPVNGYTFKEGYLLLIPSRWFQKTKISSQTF